MEKHLHLTDRKGPIKFSFQLAEQILIAKKL